MKTPNQRASENASETQSLTKEALQRIQRQVAETDAVGSLTLTTLDDQSDQSNRISRDSDRLKNAVKKSKKLQDRFAAWSFTIGTKRQARKSARKEVRDEERQQIQNVKPAVSLKNSAGSEQSAGLIPCNQEETRSETDNGAEHIKRNELFASASDQSHTNKMSFDSRGATVRSDGKELSQHEWDSLKSVERENDEIESELDLLSHRMDGLMGVASSMGEKTGWQNEKLDHINGDMDKAKEEQRIINHRARLFAMNRKQKRNDRQLQSKVSLAAKLSSNSNPSSDSKRAC